VIKKLFHFSNLFFIFVQIFKQRKILIMTCVFECFQSHCHILKELHEFLCMMGGGGGLTILLVKIVSYLVLWVMDVSSFRSTRGVMGKNHLQFLCCVKPLAACITRIKACLGFISRGHLFR
jgi:hypothetical protein